MKRRNADCGKLRRPMKRNKITESMYGRLVIDIDLLTGKQKLSQLYSLIYSTYQRHIFLQLLIINMHIVLHISILVPRSCI